MENNKLPHPPRGVEGGASLTRNAAFFQCRRHRLAPLRAETPPPFVGSGPASRDLGASWGCGLRGAVAPTSCKPCYFSRTWRTWRHSVTLSPGHLVRLLAWPPLSHVSVRRLRAGVRSLFAAGEKSFSPLLPSLPPLSPAPLGRNREELLSTLSPSWPQEKRASPDSLPPLLHSLSLSLSPLLAAGEKSLPPLSDSALSGSPLRLRQAAAIEIQKNTRAKEKDAGNKKFPMQEGRRLRGGQKRARAEEEAEEEEAEEEGAENKKMSSGQRGGTEGSIANHFGSAAEQKARARSPLFSFPLFSSIANHFGSAAEQKARARSPPLFSFPPSYSSTHTHTPTHARTKPKKTKKKKGHGGGHAVWRAQAGDSSLRAAENWPGHDGGRRGGVVFGV